MSDFKVGDTVVPKNKECFITEELHEHVSKGVKIVHVTDEGGYENVIWVPIKNGDDACGITCMEHPLHGYCWKFWGEEWEHHQGEYDPWFNPGDNWEERLRQKQNEIWKKKMGE